MNKVWGKYFGEIEFTGKIVSTKIINGKVIHDIILDEPITHFGTEQSMIRVPDEHLMLPDCMLTK